MDHYVITIARQYGSGGRTVGQMLAEKLGIEYFDKDIIRLASEDSGIHERLFGRVDEYTSAKPPMFGKNGVYKGDLIPPQSPEFTSDENLFNYQAKIIKELAETRSCIIIGRCSNYILRDYPYVLKVFICADWDFRLQRAAKKMSGTPKELEKFMQKDDKRKEEYTKRFTGTEWKNPENYDLYLDSGILGVDGCIRKIEKRLGEM